MRDFIIALMALVLCLFLIKIGMVDLRIRNLERQQLRIEKEYQAVITENQQLQRINEQNIRLLTEGGWDGIVDRPDGSSTHN